MSIQFVLASGFILLSTVTTSTRDVRVRDIVRHADHRPLTGPAADLIVLRMPSVATTRIVPLAHIAALLRRRVPAMALDLSQAGPITVTTRFSRPIPVAEPCFATIRPIATGSVLTARDVAPVACAASSDNAVVRLDYDAGSVVTRRPLEKGASLGRMILPTGAQVARGTALVLRSTMGPVTIERPVTTLQPARSGTRVFVQDKDGHVRSILLQMSDPIL